MHVEQDIIVQKEVESRFTVHQERTKMKLARADVKSALQVSIMENL